MLLLAFCGRAPTTNPSNAVPPPPDAGATTAQGTETFALDEVLLGETDRTGLASNVAWKEYGYDLDGLVTTKDSSDVCTLHGGAPKWIQTDGNDGIDNGFGAAVMPIFETALGDPTPSVRASAGLRSGLYTLQIQIEGLPDVASPVTGITVRAMRSELAGATAPAFDETTDWPVLASSLAGSDIASATWQTSEAYIADDGTFVATMPGDAVLEVPVLSDFVLRIRHATISFKPPSSHRILGGTIAGVVLSEDLVSATRNVAGAISLSLCGSAFDGIANQLRQASDILSDGTNHSGVSCDAISIGLGFTATQIANPTRVVPDPGPGDDPCTTPPIGPCTMTHVSGYTPAALRTSKWISGTCTADQLHFFWDACLGPSATRSGCNAFDAALGTCATCLFSGPTDALWGPIVADATTWSFNVAGCVPLVTGNVSCASSIAAAEGCESLACGSCGYVGGVDPLPREQCIQLADAGDCATWADAECDLLAEGASVCRVNPTDEASFTAFATVFCGK